MIDAIPWRYVRQFAVISAAFSTALFFAAMYAYAEPVDVDRSICEHIEFKKNGDDKIVRISRMNSINDAKNDALAIDQIQNGDIFYSMFSINGTKDSAYIVILHDKHNCGTRGCSADVYTPLEGGGLKRWKLFTGFADDFGIDKLNDTICFGVMLYTWKKNFFISKKSANWKLGHQ